MRASASPNTTGLAPVRPDHHLERHRLALETPSGSAVLELCAAGGSARIARDEQVMAQSQASQTLLRQLAHEIRNPWAAYAVRHNCWKRNWKRAN